MSRPKGIKWDPEELRKLYWDENLSQVEIGQIYGVTPENVFEVMRRRNIPTRNPSAAGTLLFSKKAHGTRWRGGKIIEDGYIKVYNPEHPRASLNGYVREHLLIWEQVHNKPLPKGWVIHHLNGIKDDNRPENLVAFPSQKHNLILAEKAKRIRALEANVKLLEKALDSSQMVFRINEN